MIVNFLLFLKDMEGERWLGTYFPFFFYDFVTWPEHPNITSYNFVARQNVRSNMTDKQNIKGFTTNYLH